MKTLLYISVCLLILTGCRKQQTDVPNYKAKAFLGDTVDLRSEFRDKVAVVNTWFIGCTPCMEEMPILTDTWLKYKGREDFELVTVAANTESELKQFIDPRLDSTNIFKSFALKFGIEKLNLPVLQGIEIDHKISTAIRNGKEKATGLANRDNKRMKELVTAFKSNAFPTTIIYSKEGKEAYRVSGFGQKPEAYKKLLAKKIDSLLLL